MAAKFFWYELMTTDLAAAEAFYNAVIGWNARPFPGEGPPYVVVHAGENGVGGMAAMQPQAVAMGMQPSWIGYIKAANTDAATAGVANAGGAVYRAPDDIPGVGRFSIVSDPQGAAFMLLQPIGENQGPIPRSGPGHVGWHELYANDVPSALAFYSSQFGWTGGDSMDMGEMGTYRLFHDGSSEPAGGIMDKPPHLSAPVWLFYFNVDDIDAATRRVADNGGQVLFGPMEVPGGSWITQARDPQGALFALMAQPAGAAKPADIAKPTKAAKPAKATKAAPKPAKPAKAPAARKTATKKASAKK